MPKKLPTISAQNQLKFRKSLSVLGLLARVRKKFESIKEHRIKTILKPFSYKLRNVTLCTTPLLVCELPRKAVST